MEEEKGGFWKNNQYWTAQEVFVVLMMLSIAITIIFAGIPLIWNTYIPNCSISVISTSNSGTIVGNSTYNGLCSVWERQGGFKAMG